VVCGPSSLSAASSASVKDCPGLSVGRLFQPGSRRNGHLVLTYLIILGKVEPIAAEMTTA
jgi:hypothetical protein